MPFRNSVVLCGFKRLDPYSAVAMRIDTAIWSHYTEHSGITQYDIFLKFYKNLECFLFFGQITQAARANAASSN